MVWLPARCSSTKWKLRGSKPKLNKAPGSLGDRHALAGAGPDDRPYLLATQAING